MKKTYIFFTGLLLTAVLLTAFNKTKNDTDANAVLLKNVTLIDGNGGSPATNTDILLKGDTIAAIGRNLDAAGVKVTDESGKFVIPALISTHVHIGVLKGVTTAGENYTRENILSQLKKYQDYGILNLLVMGTDRPLLFKNGFYDSLKAGLLTGARVHSAGYGFGVPQGSPATGGMMDLLYRPASPSQVPAEMDSLAKLNPEVVKIWVDDFGGTAKKMDPGIYKMIIQEAHKHKLRVAAHLWYLADARKLVADGIDIIGHSMRDSLVDDALLQEMKNKQVWYIPTLSLDDFAYIYARKPDWINDPFFKASLEPGVYEMITRDQYRDSLKNSPGYAGKIKAFETALKNLEKIYHAGILVSFGTDSGAMPVRTQGFSEHLELELMVQAGLTPLQAIGVATKNASDLLGIGDRFGTLTKGKVADLVILSDDPLVDIKNTRKIEAVYKAGRRVSNGPL